MTGGLLTVTEENDSFLLPEAILKMEKMTALHCLEGFSERENYSFAAWMFSQKGKSYQLFCCLNLKGFSERKRQQLFVAGRVAVE